MIMKRQWTNDLYAFYCAEAMDKHGVRIVAILSGLNRYVVWGQADKIDYDAIDRETDKRINKDDN